MSAAKAEGSPLRLGLLFYGAIALVAFAWRSLWDGESLWRAGGEVAGGGSVVLAVAIGSLFGLGVVWASDRLSDASEWGREMSRQLAEAIGPIARRDALLLALASGFAEEMFFRGALQPKVGLGLATLLFALAHFTPQRRLWPWVAFTAVAGLGLGLLYEWTGQLAAPIAAHVVVNGINLPRLSRLARELDDERRSRSRPAPPVEAPPPGPSPEPELDRSQSAPRRGH